MLKSADSCRVCFQIRDALRQTLNLPIDATMEYKKHTDSMRDNSSSSSYRNAIRERQLRRARQGPAGSAAQHS